jgi:hypothetical protein
MATFDRTTIVRGPCKITYDSQVFYSKDGVTLKMVNSTFDKVADAFGLLSKAKTDFQVIVEFEPVGEIESFAVLFPYGNLAMGSSIYGSADKALVITSAADTYTINNAAITQMPNIRFTSNNTAFGPVQFTGLLDKGGNPSLIADYYSRSAGASIGTNFDASKLVTAPYTGRLGSSLTFYSVSGFEVSFDLGLDPVMIDGIGTVDMRLNSIGCNISCTPVGIDSESFDTYFGSLDAGENLASSTLDISTTTAGGLNFDCLGVEVIDVEKRFSPSDNRLGQLNLTAKRTFASGVPAALFTVAVVA